MAGRPRAIWSQFCCCWQGKVPASGVAGEATNLPAAARTRTLHITRSPPYAHFYTHTRAWVLSTPRRNVNACLHNTPPPTYRRKASLVSSYPTSRHLPAGGAPAWVDSRGSSTSSARVRGRARLSRAVFLAEAVSGPAYRYARPASSKATAPPLLATRPWAERQHGRGVRAERSGHSAAAGGAIGPRPQAVWCFCWSAPHPPVRLQG